MDEEDFSRLDFGFLLISFKKIFFQNLSCEIQGAVYLGVRLICGFLWYSRFHSYFSDEFENVIKKTTFFSKIKFNFDTEFVKTYFGVNKKARIRFDDFSHLLQVSKLFFKHFQAPWYTYEYSPCNTLH